jgi:two-component system, sensor histidine kinase and response regulator
MEDRPPPISNKRVRRIFFRHGSEIRHVKPLHIDIRSETSAAPRDNEDPAQLIAELRRANEQLRRELEEERSLRERLKLATETAGIGAWDNDLTSGTLTANAQFWKVMGRSSPCSVEIFRECIHPEDHETAYRTRQAVLNDPEHRGSMTMRYRVVHPSGAVRHVRSHSQILRGGDGTALRIVGMVWDITDEIERAQQLRYQAEQDRLLRERLAVAAQAAGISPWEMDLKTQQFVWDHNRPQAFGMDHVPLERFREEMHKVIHPEDLPILRRSIPDAIASGLPFYPSRFRVLRPDGTVRHMQSHVRIVRDDQGVPISVMGATSDITNEIQTTELLQRQAEHERRLLERLSVATQAAAISTWELDLVENKFLWVENPMIAVERTDHSHRDLATFGRRLHPEDRHVFGKEIGRAAREGRDLIAYQHRCYGSDGRLMYVQSHAKLYFNEQRRAIRALGVSWEVTKEIEAAQQLAHQAQQLQDAQRRLERASLLSLEGHWEWDLLAGTAWYSSSCHSLLGYEDGALSGSALKSTMLVQLPEDIEWQREKFIGHIRDGAPYEFETRLRTGTGEVRWYKVRGMAERDQHKRAVSMAGSIHDIHQQRLAEQALEQAQRRFERAITGTQDGLWELEADGAAWCSPRVGELLGYERDELPSDTNFLQQFLHEDDAESVAAATLAHYEKGAPYDIEIRLRIKSGGHRWYRARATAERNAEGKALRLSGSLQDVTDARAAREALVRATEASEAANRAKSSFLANMSHEIRTPMNGIVGMTELLLDTELDRTQREYADTIRTSSNSLLTVINDILDFSKIEAGKLDIESVELDLRNNVEEVAVMMAFQAAAKNLEVIVDVHPDVPERVLGDPQRLRQCLINLLGNAIKFTRAGEIVLEVYAIGRHDGKMITGFEVRDTGLGIAQPTLRTLFQPFVQADSSTTRHFGGTGLGLSIVRRLVEMMGGEVGVESELGKGSTFWFTLPLEIVGPFASATSSDLTRMGRRILVVDDNETNRKVIEYQLRHVGYEVALAANAAEALTAMRQACADEYPFEVALIDYQMPDIDGAALGQQINTDEQLSQTRAVMLTSLDRHGDKRRLASLGFAGYLAKPVRGRELIACLDKVLSRDAREWHLQSQPMVTRNILTEGKQAERYAGKVLLTEDNLINQKVATRFLERLGCTVSVANNGAEAVEACRNETFDLILMDLQMPVMDGMTATRHILELQGNRRTTPIVALTANAMVGQLEICMAAGMSGFLTKPLEIARLREILDQVGLGVTQDSQSAAGIQDGVAPIDMARLHELADGDAEFLRDLVDTFVSSSADVIAELKRALDAPDRAGAARAAHKLKGASANIHAAPLAELAYALETQAATADERLLGELLAKTEREYRRAAQFLNAQLATPPSSAVGQ